MSYADVLALAARYGTARLVELTDRSEEPTGQIDTGVLARALADASAEIDSYVAGRYAVPLAPTPGAVAAACAAIAYYRLHRDRVPDETRRDYDDAVRWLRDVAAGRAQIPVPTPSQAPPSAPEIARVEGPDRTFSRDSLRGL